MEKLSPHQNIIVRRYKKGKHEDHGGAWKVAMADFALAMMALFLVLWVINSSNEQQRAAISGYFQDPKAFEEGKRVPSKYVIDLGGSPTTSNNIAVSENIDPDNVLQADEIESMAEAIEQRRMQDMMAKIQAQINASPTLSPFKNQLLLDITTEGLRLQIVDQTNRPMFDPGSAKLKYYSEDILWEMAPMLAGLDHRLSITGHTDASRLSGQRDEDDLNWGLSSMRADSARRALMEAGVPKEQIAQVIGMGDTAPLDTDNPDASVNRRIAITLLNKKSEETVEGRGSAEYNFVNGEEVPADDNRIPVINEAGSLLEQLRKKRERQDNSYDNPPNKQEVFW
ncbi:MAG: motility protein MotB [Thalassolituus sp.]|nr:MAG: motility protein MotB [Thalassolituus sp.]